MLDCKTTPPEPARVATGGEFKPAGQARFTAGRSLPLSLAKVGRTVEVSAVTGTPDLRHRLGALGFVESAPVTVISATDGNLIVDVKGARLAIGSSMARHVMTDLPPAAS